MLYHKVESELDDKLWQMFISHEGDEFTTARGLPFSYTIKRGRNGEQLGEIIIDRKEKTITRSTILLAYNNAVKVMETEGIIKGPKKLNVFGASYLYPIFISFGLINK